ncbi:peptidase YpeB-like protein [Cohnella sp. SGD-V74]|uniref:PepSY domain-containing protein n=1 Tax=unclassified Cohnella TaxID=2636738 RepID=UPI000D068032|nr:MULTISPECIES: PepSY domain-containing protein [unclassified Cohnella]PRX68865.1 peptidase YpeB-like protein [Cohnella sp. SGD-V74]
MNQRTLRLAGYIVVLAAGIGIVAALWKPWAGQQETISREALQEAVLSRYPGTVKDLVKADDQYVMLLETDQGLYQVKADAGSGEIVYLERIGGSGNVPEPSPTPSPTPEPSVSPSPSPSPTPSFPTASPDGGDSKTPVFIGAERARKIAAAHVRGTAEDVELKGAAAGNAYYLVEVDVEGGRDADVQVNAVSGAIMSVIWDDEDDKGSDDDS